MSFTEQLKNARKSAKMTQEQVARALGIDKSTYCGYETGKRRPDVERIRELASLFAVKADELLEVELEDSRDVSDAEWLLIRRYRSLDSWGKGSVDSVLAREHARCQQATALAQRYNLTAVAAHAGNATLEEQEEALVKLLDAHPEMRD